MKPSRAILVLLLLLSGAFALATLLQPRALAQAAHSQSGSIMARLFGESRRMFANDFFVKADVSFHKGYYPSIFEQARQAEERENAVANERDRHDKPSDDAHDQHDVASGFLGPPTDWIDRFGRHFRITEHKHLEGGEIREILPWLRISADLDPHRVETYTTASYYLRSYLNKPDEAEQFLREGLRANPDSYEILSELGELYYSDRHDPAHARNLWIMALRRWQERESGRKEPDFLAFDRITMQLANLEEKAGNLDEAIKRLESARMHSPNAEAIQKQIESLQAKLPGKADRR